MKINDAGLNLVKSFEGCHLTAYKCPAGVWTIGYGHTGTVDGKAICEGMRITDAKATELLKQDMAKYENAVADCSALTFTPNENQFSALVSFAFNCGAGNLKALVKGRSAAVVAEKMLLYNKANGKVLNGLTRRRQAERELFLKGVEKMSVKIGHASIDERGKISDGNAGDSTGKELCTRSWYANGWNVVLRPKMASIAEKSARACEDACANNKIGYDQNQRNTLYTKANAVGFDLSKITVACECDCSSLMHVCAIAGGAGLSYGSNGLTTRTMVNAFVATGCYEKLTASKYRTSDKYLKRGDILVKEGSHTVMVLSDGECVAEYPLKQFIKDVQAATGAEVDGIAGEETFSKTVTVSMTKNRKHAVVKPIQKRLNALGFDCGTPDCVAGLKFRSAVIAFQKANGCTADGEITAKNKTWKKLLGMA